MIIQGADLSLKMLPKDRSIVILMFGRLECLLDYENESSGAVNVGQWEENLWDMKSFRQPTSLQLL